MFWDYTKKAVKQQAKRDPLWEMQRLLEYGLGKKKLKASQMKKHFKQLRLPENRRAFLELLLWGKRF